VKRLSVSSLLVLVSVAISVSVVYAQPREEIRLTTIIPDQQVLRVKKGIISTLKYRQADFPDGNIPANSLIVAEGRVGIGTTSPDAALDMNGQIKIRGGSPAAGKVLTSDVNGLATWEPGVSTFKSGWFPVSRYTRYTIPHNLKKTPQIVQVFWSNTSDGSGDVVLYGGSNISNEYSVWVCDLDDTNIVIRTGYYWTHNYVDKDGAYKHGDGGYYKVTAIAF
jgi:hypothetical protein